MKTPSEYQKAFYERRRVAGEKKVQVWLSPSGLAALDELVTLTGSSKQLVIEEALKGMLERVNKE